MLVKCIIDSGINLPKDIYELGYTPESKIDLIIDQQYIVYSICNWRGKLHYLVWDECEMPSWYPCIMFQIVNNMIPDCWQFLFINDADEYSVNAVFGYPEMIVNESHYDELIERNKQALAIFSQRKYEIDKISNR